MDFTLFKACSRCFTYKKLDEFHNSSRSKDGKTNICKMCAKELGNTDERRAKARKYYAEHQTERLQYLEDTKVHRSQRQKEYVRKYKLNVLEHYGNKCECCGESKYEFLSIDHKNGGGNKMRKNKEHPFGGLQLYKWIVDNDYPDMFRVLCHNCNLSIGFFGYCPHGQF